jgi:hypothetical protein
MVVKIDPDREVEEVGRKVAGETASGHRGGSRNSGEARPCGGQAVAAASAEETGVDEVAT